MALDSATIWGKAVADAIKAIGVSAGTPVTDTQLEQIWAAIKGEDRSQLTTKAATATTGATGTGPAGGPLPIAAVPGVIT